MVFLPPYFFYFQKESKIKNGIRKNLSRTEVVQIPSFGGGRGRSNLKSFYV